MKEIINQLASQNLLQDIVEGVPIRIFWKDRECKYLGCNTLFANDAGLSYPDELIGKTDFDMSWCDQAERYRADDFSVMESGESKLGFEEPQTTPDGETIWLRTSKVPLLDHEQKVIGLLGIYEDISKQKQDEEDLQAIRHRHKEAQRIAHLGHWRLNLSSNELLWSEEVFRIFEIDSEQFGASYEAFLDVIHPDDREYVNKAYNDSLESRKGYDIEHRLLMKNGSIKWVQERCETSYADDGTALRSIGTVLDITERKMFEERLNASETRFRDLFEESPDPCWIINEDNLFMFCNQAASEILGYDSIEELKATHPSKLSPDLQPDGRESFEKANEMIAAAHEQGVHRFEWRHRRKNGECFPVEVTLAQIEIDGKKELYCIWRDISARKKTEAELYNSEKELRGIFDSLQDVYYRTDTGGQLVKISPSVKQLMGCSADEMLGEDIAQFYVDAGGREKFLDAMQQGDGVVRNYEAEIRREDGQTAWVSTNAHFLYGENGSVIGVEGSIRDISERKKQQGLLETSKKRFQTLFESSSDGIFISNMDGEFVDINRTSYQRLGYTKDELMALGVGKLNPPEFRARIPEIIAKLRQQRSGTFETGHYRKDGSIMPVEINTNIIELDGEEVFFSVVRDISERKKTEQELHLAKFVIDNAPLNITFVDADARIRYLNKAGCETLGYTREEALNLSIPDIDPLFPMEVWDEHWNDLKNSKSVTVETQHQRKNGEVFPIEVSANYMEFGGQAYNVAFDQDISERKLADAARQRFRLAVDNSADAVFLIDRTSMQFVDVNEVACQQMGYTPEELLTMGPVDIKPYLTRAQLESKFDRAISHSEESTTIETIHACKDGSEFPVEVRLKPFKENNKQLLVAVARDVTESNQHRDQLEISQKRFRVLFDSSSDGLFIIDMQGNFIDINRTAYERLGYTKEEMLAMKLTELDPPEYAARVPERIEQILNHGMAVFESAHYRKDGSIMPVEINARVLELGGEQVFFSVIRDISERKQLEEQLRQAQKMEAIGTLVGGIAHDFNNMLAAIQGNVYLARMQMQGHPVAIDKLTNIEKLGLRGAEMVQQLLTFARKDSVVMRTFALNAFLDEGSNLAKTLIPENIEFHTILCEEELHIKGDATQLQQVLMNLLNNAVDAVTDVQHPKIRCRLSPYKADNYFLKRYPALEGRHFACISVEDNGHGIAGENLDKIFEPFFTTKDVGKGTGLGLAMLYGALQSHGGVVEVDSKVNRGTAFHIYLPLSEEKSEKHAQELANLTDGEGKTILLTDDDENVRSSTSEVLTSMAYHVLEARDGVEALELFTSNHEKIDLIISDVIMPNMGGVDLLNSVRQLDEEMPFILVTGYDKSQMMNQGIESQQCQVMNKPFDFNLLSQSIKELTRE